MKNILYFILITLLLVNCNSWDKYEQCMKTKDLDKFNLELSYLENHLIDCNLINDLSLKGFKEFLDTYNVNEIILKNCLKSLKTEGCNINDYYSSYYCCKGVDENICAKLVEILDRGDDIIINDLSELLDLIDNNTWNNRPGLRGFVVFSVYFFSTKRK